MFFHVTAIFFTVGYAIVLTFLPKDFPHRLAWQFYMGVFLLLTLALLGILCADFLRNSPKLKNLYQLKKHFPFIAKFLNAKFLKILKNPFPPKKSFSASPKKISKQAGSKKSKPLAKTLAIRLLFRFFPHLLPKNRMQKTPHSKKATPLALRFFSHLFAKIQTTKTQNSKSQTQKIPRLKIIKLLALCIFLAIIALSFHKDFLQFEKTKQQLVNFPLKNIPTPASVNNENATKKIQKKWRGIIKSDHIFNGKYFVLRLELNPPDLNSSKLKSSELNSSEPNLISQDGEAPLKNGALIEIRTTGKPRWLIPGVETEVDFRHISWLKGIKENAAAGYVDYLVANKIAGIGYTVVKNFTFVKDHASFPIRLKRNILFFVEEKANNHLSPDVAALVMALMSGEKNHLASDLRQHFIDSGTYHILAISGLHVGLWIALFLAAFQLLKIPLRFSMIFIVLFILPFLLFLSDFPISAIRAYGLAFLAVLLFLEDRSFNLLKLITVFFFIFLFGNEHGFYALYFLSFQLSYGAVFAIFLVLPHFQKGPLKDLHLLSKTFVITLVCQVATLPFILYAFGYLHFFSSFYNFIAVPLISLFLLYTLLFLLSPFTWLSHYLSGGVEMTGQLLFLLLSPSFIDHPNLTLDLSRGALSNVFYIVLGLVIFGLLFFMCLRKTAIENKSN